MTKWLCESCAQENNRHATYCLACGQTRIDDTVMWVCPVCEHDNPEEVTYCQKCRHWLLSEDYAAVQVGGQVVKFQKVERQELLVPIIARVEVVALLVFSIGPLLRARGEVAVAAPSIVLIVFGLHVIFSSFYVSRAFSRGGTRRAGRQLLWHGLVLVVLLIVLGLLQQ